MATFAPAHAQNVPAFQTGTLIPGDALKGITQGRYGSAGTILGDSNGRGVNPFSVTSSGYGFCVNDALTTGAYNAICIGFNEAGNAALSLRSSGGASAGFQIDVNGTVVDLDFSGAYIDFDNVGAVGTTIFTLPNASIIAPTRCYTVAAAQILRITAPTGETISIDDTTTTSAGGSIESSAPHSSVCLHSREGAKWVARSVVGGWTPD